jgi:hypothetical protein
MCLCGRKEYDAELKESKTKMKPPEYPGRVTGTSPNTTFSTRYEVSRICLSQNLAQTEI